VFTGTVVVPDTLRQIVQHGKLMLISAADQTVIETVAFDGGVLSPRERICTRSGTEVKLPE
jgi:hypothetical protein